MSFGKLLFSQPEIDGSMKLFLVLFLMTAVARGKIIIEKWDIQHDNKFADVKHVINNGHSMTIDVICLADADDIIVDAAAYSKVDGQYNPFVRPDAIHICKVHEHDDPLVQFMHEEILKFGNITKACPLKKGEYYYMHDFVIDETQFPMPLPEGEFRLDTNISIMEGGSIKHAYSSEVFFKTVRD